MKNTDILSNPSIMVIFTYAPAGLGHLRVTDSLYHGLPKGVTPVLLGSEDTSIGIVHRLMSIHPIGRSIMEFLQYGWPEEFFTVIYRNFLRQQTKSLYGKIETLLKQRIVLPQTVLVIATHFGLAHQIAAVKEKLMVENNLQIFLIVQVTDDSPQHVWYVPGADLTFVPSKFTMKQLSVYGQRFKLPPIQITEAPYPVSPILANPLNPQKVAIRRNSLTPGNKSEIHISVPVSGAAVGMRYITALTGELNQLSPRFVFHIVAKISPYTQTFLQKLENRTQVKLYSFFHDREVVDSYEKLFQKVIIALEITKPSEQAFKALINPDSTGGPVLLFSQPVGRQEYDNLNFLERHKLIASQKIQKRLWGKAIANTNLSGKEGKLLLLQAESWRAICLPQNPDISARFIFWCLSQGIFLRMSKCRISRLNDNGDGNVIADNGVEIFWEYVGLFMKEKILG